MKYKSTLIALISALFLVPAHGQTPLDSLYAAYDSLNPANIPSGILLNRAPYIKGVGHNPKLFDGGFNNRHRF